MSRARPSGLDVRAGLVLALLLLAALLSPAPARAVTIPELYTQLPGAVGSTVTVEAFYTNPADQLLVSDYDLFRADRVMPPFTHARIDGPAPPAPLWFGAFVAVTGVVDTVHLDDPEWPEQTAVVVIRDPVYVLLLPPPDLVPEGAGALPEIAPEGAAATCDSCKFAVLLSGGANQNHARYWNNLKNLYQYKTQNAGYCPHNIKVLYATGDSEDEAAIPGAAIDSCTKPNVQKAFSDVAKGVADCQRKGRKATLQVLVTNHGDTLGVINLLGSGELLAAELRAMIQACIDSCLSELNVEMVQCYGGPVANALRSLDDKNKTRMDVSSGAGNGLHWSAGGADGGYAPFLKFKLDSLRAGKSYEKAVRGALAEYDSLLRKWGKSTERGQSVHWRSYPMNTYCEYRRVEVPAGGQLVLDFSGSGTCGNVTVWEELPNGEWVRRATWNWNVPGGRFYEPGNERRVVHASPGAPSVFWIHNDAPTGKPYRIIAGSVQTLVSPESPTNLHAYAGFSLGWRDTSAAEFGDIASPMHVVPAADQPGFVLGVAPRAIGPGGAERMVVQFTQTGNPLWADMELWLRVLDVAVPGELWTHALSPAGVVVTQVSAPGEYVIPLGAITGSELWINDGLPLPSMAAFSLDAWGLRVVDGTTAAPGPGIAGRFRVAPPRPHPFRPGGALAFEIPRDAHVRVAIYDLRGARVRTLADGWREAGEHRVTWDGHVEGDARAPAGVYFYRVESGPFSGGGKLVVLD